MGQWVGGKWVNGLVVGFMVAIFVCFLTETAKVDHGFVDLLLRQYIWFSLKSPQQEFDEERQQMHLYKEDF